MPTTPGNDVAQNHERHRKNADVPKWLPFALLTVTTAALAVPIVWLRRQRTNALANSPPPPRRTRTLPSQLTSTYRPTPKPNVPPARAATDNQTTAKDDGFNGALYSAKAFGFATLFVTLGAFGGIWGVRTYLDVRNTEEFGARVRAIMLNKMPTLASRIHREANVDEEQMEEAMADDDDWDWQDAQKRLTEAFEKDGFHGWAETALKEVEAEARLERMRRGLVADPRDGDDSSGC